MADIPIETLFAVTVLAALVQGSIGIGLGLLLTPAVALFAPQLLPTVPILLALPLTVVLFLHERAHLDTSGLGWVMAGHVVGAIVGASVLSLASTDVRMLTAGLVVLAAVVASVAQPVVRLSAVTAWSAGGASGLMNTVAGLAGPPILLLYQRRPGPVIRSTTSAIFTLATLPAIAALAAAGQVQVHQLRAVAALLPAVLVGFLAARVLRRWIDGSILHPALLVVAGFAGIIAVVRGAF